MEMKKRQIKCYGDFVSNLLETGFSMGSGNSENIYSVLSWDWGESPPYDTPIRWHTGDAETDPWEWRMRVLDERKDIAYAKVFFKKSGYITERWYPYFLAARRGGLTLEEEYANGLISNHAKRIYGVIHEYGALPVHAIKEIGGFGRDEKSAFDRGLTELQMKMYLTMCGRQQKISQKGEAYGWSSTMFCTAESFFGGNVFEKTAKIGREEAVKNITEQIYRLNPCAEEKKIKKFIRG